MITCNIVFAHTDDDDAQYIIFETLNLEIMSCLSLGNLNSKVKIHCKLYQSIFYARSGCLNSIIQSTFIHCLDDLCQKIKVNIYLFLGFFFQLDWFLLILFCFVFVCFFFFLHIFHFIIIFTLSETLTLYQSFISISNSLKHFTSNQVLFVFLMNKAFTHTSLNAIGEILSKIGDN